MFALFINEPKTFLPFSTPSCTPKTRVTKIEHILCKNTWKCVMSNENLSVMISNHPKKMQTK